MMQKERMQYNIYVCRCRYRDILQPACCNGSQKETKRRRI